MQGTEEDDRADRMSLWRREDRERMWQERLGAGIQLGGPDAGEPLGEGDTRLMTVDGTSSPASQQVAHDLAVLAKRDMGLVYTAWGRVESVGSSHPHAFILVQEDRAIGVVVLRQRRRWEQVTWDSKLDDVHPERRDEARWSMEIMWLARRHRGRGYGRLLINMALFHLETPAPEVAWTLPLSSDGERLIRSMTPDRLYVA